MIDAVRVRPATAADAKRIAELSGTLGYPTEAGALTSRLERLLARDGELVVVAESATGDVVGWVYAVEREALEFPARGEIMGLVVDAGARRAGVGRQLVVAVERWAAGRGLDRVVVRSNVVRPESHPFYEGIGYARVKTQHTYSKPLTPRDG
ncbi:MAG: GNAT family N-acetyltransferase [Gemmatimonadaceae bacterium]